MVKGGCYINTMLLNDDASAWNIYMTISTSADNGVPRYGDSELVQAVTLNEGQIRTNLIAHAKAHITATWGVEFGSNDTVQLWSCQRSEG